MTSDNALLGIAPRLQEGLNLPRLQLSAADGFLLSQIDGQTPARVLADVVAIEPAAMVAALTRLEKIGVIRWAALEGGPVPPAASHPSLSEPGDLSRDERLRILELDSRLARVSYWELLGVSGEAQTAEIKRAYFAACKSFHPDRYFGRELGSFAGRLDRIFVAIKMAYDTLADETKRNAYRARHPPPQELAAARSAARAEASAAEVAKPAPAVAAPAESEEQKRERLEKRRQEILAERQRRRLGTTLASPAPAPLASSRDTRQRKAEEMYNSGLAELRGGQVFAAVASLKLALSYEPDNSRYKAMFEECNTRAMAARAHELFEQGSSEETRGDSAAAATLFARAFELSPSRVDYAVRGALALLNSGGAEKALQLARQALEVSPRRADARLAAAAALEALGDPVAALGELQAVDRLDQDDGRVKKAVRRLSRLLERGTTSS